MQDEIHVDAPVPWGEDTLFTLEFRPTASADIDGNGDRAKSVGGGGGYYALHTCNNKYLARDGKLLDTCTRDCLYAAEFHAGLLALRYKYTIYNTVHVQCTYSTYSTYVYLNRFDIVVVVVVVVVVSIEKALFLLFIMYVAALILN